MNRRRSLGVFILLLLAAAPAIRAEPPTARPSIDSLTARLEQQRALVTFRLTGGFPEETLERLRSGIPVTFRHRVEVVARRGFPWFPPRVIVRAVIETTARYDALTRRYDLKRTVAIKPERRKHEPPPREENSHTASVDDMKLFMSEFENISVFDPYRAIEGERLRVRVQSTIGRRYVMSIFPAKLTATAETVLER